MNIILWHLFYTRVIILINGVAIYAMATVMTIVMVTTNNVIEMIVPSLYDCYNHHQQQQQQHYQWQ